MQVFSRLFHEKESVTQVSAVEAGLDVKGGEHVVHALRVVLSDIVKGFHWTIMDRGPVAGSGKACGYDVRAR